MRTLFFLTLAVAFGLANPGVIAGSDEGPDNQPNTTNNGGNFFNEAVQIRGDLCAGEECTDGETSVLGTIRIDSDHPSIDFNDASTTAGFPTNDWRLQVNDTGNGGADYFAVQDTSNGTRPFHIESAAPSDSLMVESSGEIGIGTSSPTSDLNIQDDGSIQITFTNTNPGKPAWKFTNNDNTGNFRITVDGSGKQEFDLTTDGDLSLTGSLTVCSKGAASTSGTCAGSVVNLPDYVFAPGYQPMSLGELESFVTTNRHLPGVLSASDAARDGIDVVELQVGVLQNVEELLLHTIDQQRTLDALAAELEAQRAANADLESRLAALEAHLGAGG